MKKSTIIKTLGIVTAFSIAIPSAGILAKNAVQSSASEYSITQVEEASELSDNVSENTTVFASANSTNTADNNPGNPPDGEPPEGNPPDGNPGTPPDGMPGGN
ncbi:MAG: hypothetical protein J6Y89_01600, partial [Lachnospiraceae bacterium]|nr:hypothetical protein [Lachnospiraceae bacterium]